MDRSQSNLSNSIQFGVGLHVSDEQEFSAIIIYPKIYDFYPWCRPLDQLTHFFLYMFYYNSIDLNQIYQIVYNLEWVYMFLMNKSFLQLLYTLQYMIFYQWCRALDPFIHFFLYMFYYNSIDLNQIYQIVYNLEWVYMFLMNKSFLQLLYTLWHMIFYPWCRH